MMGETDADDSSRALAWRWCADPYSRRTGPPRRQSTAGMSSSGCTSLQRSATSSRRGAIIASVHPKRLRRGGGAAAGRALGAAHNFVEPLPLSTGSVAHALRRCAARRRVDAAFASGSGEEARKHPNPRSTGTSVRVPAGRPSTAEAAPAHARRDHTSAACHRQVGATSSRRWPRSSPRRQRAELGFVAAPPRALGGGGRAR